MDNQDVTVWSGGSHIIYCGSTAFMCAADNGHADTVEALLGAGVDVN